MLRDKIFIWALISYMAFQLATLFLGFGFFLFIYVILYIIAIIYATIQSCRSLTQDQNFKGGAYSLSYFFIVNLILFLIYLPTLIYNPEINWKLKGGVEQDPMILQAYVPILFFIIAATVLIVALLIAKLFSRRSRLT